MLNITLQAVFYIYQYFYCLRGPSVCYGTSKQFLVTNKP